MAVDNTLIIKKLQGTEKIYAAYCAPTNMPLMVCDPETFNDQIWIFDTEEAFKAFAEAKVKEHYMMKGVCIENKDNGQAYGSFFVNAYLCGANEIAFVSEGATGFIPLESIIKVPDFSSLPENKRPVSNPNLQLTGLYFMQSASRKMPEEEKTDLKDLEEEFAANVLKSRFLVPVMLKEGPGTVQEKMKNKEFGFPLIKDPNGVSYQPIFTDEIEFKKFAKDNNKLLGIGMPFAQLTSLLSKEAKGYMLNPLGYHIVLTRQLLEALPKRFQ